MVGNNQSKAGYEKPLIRKSQAMLIGHKICEGQNIKKEVGHNLTDSSFKVNESQKRACIITNGCLECRLDCAQLDNFIKDNLGYRLSKNPQNAELIIFKGCSFNQDKEDLSCHIIKELERLKHPNAQILVTGCIAKLRPELACNSEELKGLVDQINRFSRFETDLNHTANFPYPEFW